MFFMYNHTVPKMTQFVMRNPKLILRHNDLFNKVIKDRVILILTQKKGESALSRITVSITHLDLLYLYNDSFLSCIIDASRLCRGILRVHIHRLDLRLRFLSLEIYT